MSECNLAMAHDGWRRAVISRVSAQSIAKLIGGWAMRWQETA
ncbi:MAG: hypothetical protein ACYDC3_13415 [Candidatus Binataceae bacterium]